jgi:DNA-binding transcriptional regulator YiaG
MQSARVARIARGAYLPCPTVESTLDARAETLALRRFHRLAQTGRLTELREQAGLSQSDLARFLGIQPSNVSRWEAGKARPRGHHAVAVLQLLDEAQT